jgi:hypothetical protein
MLIGSAGILIARHGKQSAGGKAAAGPTVLGMPRWKLAHLGCQYAGIALVATAIGIAWCHMYGNTAASVAGSLLFHAHKYIGMAVVVMIGGQVSRLSLWPADRAWQKAASVLSESCRCRLGTAAMHLAHTALASTRFAAGAGGPHVKARHSRGL